MAANGAGTARQGFVLFTDFVLSCKEQKSTSVGILLDSATSAVIPAELEACLACCTSVLALKLSFQRSTEVILKCSQILPLCSKHQWVLITVKIKPKLFYMRCPHVVWSLPAFQPHPLSWWSSCCQWTCQGWAHLWLCTCSYRRFRIFPWLLVPQVSAHSAEEPSLTILFKTAPILYLSYYFVLFLAHWLDLFVSLCLAFTPAWLPSPVTIECVVGRQGSLLPYSGCNPSVQHLGAVPDRRLKKNLLFVPHAYHIRSYVPITLFAVNPKLYSYNFMSYLLLSPKIPLSSSYPFWAALCAFRAILI